MGGFTMFPAGGGGCEGAGWGSVALETGAAGVEDF